MSFNKHYAKKLDNPVWKDLRRKVFIRDEFACRFCSNKNIKLDVHHLMYLKDAEGKYKDPWHYPMYFFVSLCRDCHNAANVPNGFNSELLAAASIFLEIKNEYFFSLSRELRTFVETQGADKLYKMLRRQNDRFMDEHEITVLDNYKILA